MLTLVNVLIVFFIILIGYQIILANHVVEGLKNNSNSSNNSYKPYPQDPLILAKQNAGNIEYLKNKIDDLQNINSVVNDLSGNVASLQQQVNGLVTTQQQLVTQMTGGSPPDVTGATDDSLTDVQDTSDLVSE
jgi:hypothetical protein